MSKETVRGVYTDPVTGEKMLVEAVWPPRPQPDWSSGVPVKVPTIQGVLAKIAGNADRLQGSLIKILAERDLTESQMIRTVDSLIRGSIPAAVKAELAEESNKESEGESKEESKESK